MKTIHKISFLLFSLLILGLSVFIFIFIHKQIAKNLKVAGEAQSTWQAEDASRTEARTLDQTIKNIQNERTELETHFAKGSDIVPFLDTLEALATRVGAKAEVSAVEVMTEEKALRVGLKAVGSFESLYKLIKLLENSPYELEFNSIELGTEERDVDSPPTSPEWNAIFNIKLLTFTP